MLQARAAVTFIGTDLPATCTDLLLKAAVSSKVVTSLINIKIIIMFSWGFLRPFIL